MAVRKLADAIKKPLLTNSTIANGRDQTNLMTHTVSVAAHAKKTLWLPLC
jgi:hypothetical protein